MPAATSSLPRDRTAMLRIRGLRKTVGRPPSERILFEGLDLDAAAGEILAIMGESGSGKSTLLNLIAGLDVPDAGRIEIDGSSPAALGDSERAQFRRTHLGFVFQAFHLLPYLSIADNVGLPLVLLACPSSERSRRIDLALREVGLEDRGRALPRELSGGEMQRVAIARALIHRPRLILADEPTGNLDADSAAQVMRLLRDRVESAHAACILVTHSPTAARAAHRSATLAEGRLTHAS
jgi:putative ABC transport system ATP-binding protein